MQITWAHIPIVALGDLVLLNLFVLILQIVANLQRKCTSVTPTAFDVAHILSGIDLILEQGRARSHRLHVWRVDSAEVVDRGLSVLFSAVTNRVLIRDGPISRLSKVRLEVYGTG